MFNFYTAVKALGIRGSLAALIFIVTGTIWLMNCFEGTYDGELSQGQQVIYQMMGPENLEYAGFFDEYPEARPSDFVEFVTSEKGQVLWPPTIREHRDNHDPTKRPGAGAGRFLQPDNITFSPYRVDPSGGKQVVYIPHDDLGQIEFKGYVTPDERPFQTSKWDFPSTGKAIDF